MRTDGYLNAVLMSYTELYIHAVFATKRRLPVLSDDGRRALFNHLRQMAAEHHISLLAINGYTDHVHMLVRLHSTQPVAAVMQQLKGESARWANQAALFSTPLVWAKGYYARSVDPGRVGKVVHYIAIQPEKHTQQYHWLYQYLQMISAEAGGSSH